MKTRKRALAPGLLALLVVSATLNSRGAVDAFLRFTEPAGGAAACPGESNDEQFPGKDGWFGITSFDNGILNATTIGSVTEGAGVGKTTFQDFHFTKHPNSASPALFKTSAAGGHYQQAELALRQASADGKSAKPFYTAKLRTVFVNSMNWSGPGDEGPEESIAMSYVAIEWSFTRFDSDGTPATTVTVNWNEVANTGGDGPFLPPTLLLATPDITSRVLGRSIKISAQTLTANDSAGAVFDGLPSDATALGGHVSLSGATIIYDPPTPDPGTDDTFSYRIRDSFGQTQTGTVTVGVGNPSGPSGNLIIRVTSGETTLRLAGIPGRKYQLQKAADVNGPWNGLGDVVTADVNGSAAWTDSDPTSPRFFRAYNVP